MWDRIWLVVVLVTVCRGAADNLMLMLQKTKARTIKKDLEFIDKNNYLFHLF